ncbi:MAG: hypothetical protein JNJ71_00800 [Rubrivivax sp.]|nr:hypothetical protein [Rubrivivax sp.]
MTERRLLILDDDATIAQILLASARAASLAARWHARLAPFLEDAADWQPTHLLIDLTLPEQEPSQVMQALAHQRCTAQIIICSGRDAGECQAALALAGSLGLRPGGVLTKPFTQQQFRALLAPAGA